MTKQELLKDLFKRVLDEVKTAERCKQQAIEKKDNNYWVWSNNKSEKLTKELLDIVEELIK